MNIAIHRPMIVPETISRGVAAAQGAHRQAPAQNTQTAAHPHLTSAENVVGDCQGRAPNEVQRQASALSASSLSIRGLKGMFGRRPMDKAQVAKVAARVRDVARELQGASNRLTDLDSRGASRASSNLGGFATAAQQYLQSIPDHAASHPGLEQQLDELSAFALKTLASQLPDLEAKVAGAHEFNGVMHQLANFFNRIGIQSEMLLEQHVAISEDWRSGEKVPLLVDSVPLLEQVGEQLQYTVDAGREMKEMHRGVRDFVSDEGTSKLTLAPPENIHEVEQIQAFEAGLAALQIRAAKAQEFGNALGELGNKVDGLESACGSLRAATPELHAALRSVYSERVEVKAVDEWFADHQTGLDLLNGDSKKLTEMSDALLRFMDGSAETSSVSVADLAKEITLVSPYGSDHSTDFDITGTKGDLRAQCAPNLLLQVLVNIVNNGAEASQEHHAKGDVKPKLEISCRSVGGKVAFTIKDNGPGMTEATQSRIFDRGETSKAQGTGVGLWLARSMMEKMNGEIKVDSKVGQGSTFTVVVPSAPKDSPRV